MSEENTQRVPTKEELAERKKELTAFYKGELPLLRLQSEYEELLTKIEVSKMQRIDIMIARAQMMEGQQDQKEHQEEETQEEPVEHVIPANKKPAETVKTTSDKKPVKRKPIKNEKNETNSKKTCR